MGYPKLVPKAFCTVPIHVRIIGEGLNEDGGPDVAFDAQLFCNYQDSAKTVQTKDKKTVQLTGVALFHEDFCPEIQTISDGTATVFGEKREIVCGAKARNSDGTVNFVELGLR